MRTEHGFTELDYTIAKAQNEEMDAMTTDAFFELTDFECENMNELYDENEAIIEEWETLQSHIDYINSI
jgi:hypothetical protein